MKHKRDLLLGEIFIQRTTTSFQERTEIVNKLRNTCFEYENILMNFHYETTMFGLDEEDNQSLNSTYTANLVSESESEIESEEEKKMNCKIQKNLYHGRFMM